MGANAPPRSFSHSMDCNYLCNRLPEWYLAQCATSMTKTDHLKIKGNWWLHNDDYYNSEQTVSAESLQNQWISRTSITKSMNTAYSQVLIDSIRHSCGVSQRIHYKSNYTMPINYYSWEHRWHTDVWYHGVSVLLPTHGKWCLHNCVAAHELQTA